MIKNDIVQFLQAEDILNYFTDAYSPIFDPSFKDTVVGSVLTSIFTAEQELQTEGSTYQANFAAQSTVADLEYVGFLSEKTRPFDDVKSEIRTTLGWLSSMQSSKLLPKLPIFNAALLYISFELGLNRYEIGPNYVDSTGNNPYIPDFLRTLASRSLLYLARKGILKGFITDELEAVLADEKYLANKGILVDEFFDSANISSAFIELFPTIKKFNDLNVSQFLNTDDFIIDNEDTIKDMKLCFQERFRFLLIFLIQLKFQ